MNSGDLNIDLRKKMTEEVSKLFFYELSNAACRFDLRFLEAELERGASKPPPPPHEAGGAEHRHGAG